MTATMTAAVSLFGTSIPDRELYGRLVRSIDADPEKAFRRIPSLSHPRCAELKDWLLDHWHLLVPMSFAEAIALPEAMRGVVFRCLGPGNVFRGAGAKLVASEEIPRRTEKLVDGMWRTGTRMETYELYAVSRAALNIRGGWGDIHAVRCTCPSTNEEHWLLVQGRSRGETDPIAAVASTIVVNIKNPKKLYRQGDLLAVAYDGHPQYCEPEPLTREAYLQLSYLET